jgi:uncharacterized membrane protein YedE/YeeE
VTDFTPVSALAGGVLIGLAASFFLLLHGRVAGISGLYGGLLRKDSASRALGFWFIAGLVVVGGVVRVLAPGAFATAWSASLPAVVVGGLLVGVGTTLGGGCTSGHGVCGMSRFSVRSVLATVTFMATGALTVFVVRHLLGAHR